MHTIASLDLEYVINGEALRGEQAYREFVIKRLLPKVEAYCDELEKRYGKHNLKIEDINIEVDTETWEEEYILANILGQLEEQLELAIEEDTGVDKIVNGGYENIYLYYVRTGIFTEQYTTEEAVVFSAEEEQEIINLIALDKKALHRVLQLIGYKKVVQILERLIEGTNLLTYMKKSGNIEMYEQLSSRISARKVSASEVIQLMLAEGGRSPIEVVQEIAKMVSAKKEKKVAIRKAISDIVVSNCGVLLLHPFLKPYFEALGLLSEGVITDELRAVQLLHYLATGNEWPLDIELTLEKVLLGVDLERVLVVEKALSEKEKEVSEQLLQAVIRYWPALKNTSINGLQHLFLTRGGRLLLADGEIKITVDSAAQDVLLDKLEWGISMIKLPWLLQLIQVKWR